MITIRVENAGDIPAVRRLNELAFGRPHEAALVDALRAASSPQLSLVAVENGQVVGHIFFSPVSIESEAPLLRRWVLRRWRSCLNIKGKALARSWFARD